MRTLFRALSYLDVPRKVVIGEILLINTCHEEYEKIGVSLIAKRSILKASVRHKKMELITTMLPYKDTEEREELYKDDVVGISEFCLSREDGTEVWKKVFAEREIINFVEDVEDQNPIHRIDPYVVPGCLLLEWMSQCVTVFRSVKLRFMHPLYANDELVMRKKEKILCIYVRRDTQWVVACKGFVEE